MLGSLTSWFPRDGEQSAAAIRGRKRTRVRYGMEPLEGRNLLSTVRRPDQPPVLAPLGAQSVEEGSTLAVQVTATDPNPGHTVTYSLDPGAPAGATINPTIRSLRLDATQRADDLRDPDPRHRQRAAGPERHRDPVRHGLRRAPQRQRRHQRHDRPGDRVRPVGQLRRPQPRLLDGHRRLRRWSGVQPLALDQDKTFTLDHTYATPGTYVVGVTIIDSQGGQGHGYFAVQVQPPDTPNPPRRQPRGRPATPVPAGTSQGQFQVQALSTPNGERRPRRTKGHGESPSHRQDQTRPRAHSGQACRSRARASLTPRPGRDSRLPSRSRRDDQVAELGVGRLDVDGQLMGPQGLRSSSAPPSRRRSGGQTPHGGWPRALPRPPPGASARSAEPR